MAELTRVCLELGKTWVFASALDWPGWCRRGKGEEAAIDELLEYRQRYAVVAGRGFKPGEISVVGRTPGTSTTDFGAPDVSGEWDDQPLSKPEARRLTSLLEASWSYFDEVVESAPEQLRKGPRGGGRDRDAVVAHVQEAERSYGRKVGVRVPPRTPWPEQRQAIAASLRTGSSDGAWPARYAIRRLGWHVLDHAWEIEDKGD
ncbi:MAG TPA: hypothetical protein VMT88_04625 [Actinomycetes bacterium]|nr:hypothetical protein [Actinomycetes bacterium]